jgi:hypothetical protein
MILGQSGTGKSTSLRNFKPEDVLLIKAIDKPLPFKAKNWKSLSADGGNVYSTDHYSHIISAMQKTKRDIIVIDDFQYIMANEFMRRSNERGYDKFTDIADHAWRIIDEAGRLPPNKRVYILSHIGSDDFGREKIKTIGKMLDEKITLEGMVTVCLKTVVQDGKYFFATQNSGNDTVKSPIDMFNSLLIDNDLAAVDSAITDYYDLKK